MEKKVSNTYRFKNFYRFIFYGIINVFVTNLFLQILLISINTIIATLIGQIINLLLGFYFYGYKVFEIKKFKIAYLVKYLLLHLSIWNLNWSLIEVLNSFGFSKNLSALFLITPLALFSYLSQKFIIFKRN